MPTGETVQEQAPALDFSDYISTRTRDFTGREWVFRKIDRWLADEAASRFFLLTGEPGIGKTAIAGRLTQFSSEAETLPTGCDRLGSGFLSAVHFCYARHGGWISPDGFARSLSAQLAARYHTFAQAVGSAIAPRLIVKQTVTENWGNIVGVHIASYHAESAEAVFNALVRDPLKELCGAAELSRPPVIIIDGLDESLKYSGAPTILELLTCWRDLPRQVRVLLTSRHVDRVLGPLRSLDPFIVRADTTENRRDIRAYVRGRFKSPPLHAMLPDGLKVDAVADRFTTGGGNFLVVSSVLDAVTSGELSLDDLSALPAELQELYVWFLERVTKGDVERWRSLYRPVLGILLAAAEPVDAQWVVRMAEIDEQLVPDALSDLRELVDPTLSSRYHVYHESLADFLCDAGPESYRIALPGYHRRIAEWYTGEYARPGKGWGDCDAYGLRNLPTHLAGAGQRDELREFLLDFDWLQAKLEATDVHSLLMDYELWLRRTVKST